VHGAMPAVRIRRFMVEMVPGAPKNKLSVSRLTEQVWSEKRGAFTARRPAMQARIEEDVREILPLWA
jgi:hypothetical protein